MLLNCGVGEDSWESLGLQRDPASPSSRRSVLSVHWKDWCWSWNSSTLATWCEELTHLKRPWCWERLKAGEGDDRGWGGWMASPIRWRWVWVKSGNWWWTGRPGVLCSIGLWKVRHDWVIELNWTEYIACCCLVVSYSFAAPWTVTPQAPLSWDFPGKNTRVGCHFLLWGLFWPRDWSCVSCIAGGFFDTKPPGLPWYHLWSEKQIRW